MEATSLLGEPLRAPAIEPDRRRTLETNLERAQVELRREPTSEEAVIWVGRRYAYLGEYREAIAVFTEGLRVHPESAKLLRHRGHRWITVREFDKAIADLSRAAMLSRGTLDEVEPDGAPNAYGVPRSTLHTNIYYHLGLAKYLTGDFAGAAGAFGKCLEISPNDDMRVASVNWLYLSLRRAGRGDEAARALAVVRPDMEILENEAYLRLTLFYEGRLSRSAALGGGEGIDGTTAAYGVGAWLVCEGKAEEARAVFERIVAGEDWASFGHIAAEAEVARGRG